MKSLRWQAQVAVGVVILMTGIGSAHAQIMGAPADGKTLQDFQREYSGTKPFVAFEQYQAYRRALRAGREVVIRPAMVQVGVTDEFRMRNTGKTLSDFLRAYSFTKPVVGMQKYLEYHSRMNR